MEHYIAYLISQGKCWMDLNEVVAGFAEHTAFATFKETSSGIRFGLSREAAAEMDAGRKIGAIKIVRQETGLGLKEAKDIVDAAQVANPQWDTPYRAPLRPVYHPTTLDETASEREDRLDRLDNEALAERRGW